MCIVDTCCVGLSVNNVSTVHSESRCALWLRYADLVVSIEVAVEVCCCYTGVSCYTAVVVHYR
jgi:hypothetical protein